MGCNITALVHRKLIQALKVVYTREPKKMGTMFSPLECIIVTAKPDWNIVRAWRPQENTVWLFSLGMVGGVSIAFPSVVLTLGPLNFKHKNVVVFTGAITRDSFTVPIRLIQTPKWVMKTPCKIPGRLPIVESSAQVTSAVQGIPCNTEVWRSHITHCPPQ